MNYENCLDFRLDFNVERNIRVLQITDMQPVDISQQRFDGRLNDAPYGSEFTDEMKWNGEFYYLDKAIKDNNPDLIIVTGDIVYGEFDDNGKNLIEFCNFMDKYQIPWAPVFGNHDNECKLGVTWQCEQFINSKYCLFKRNNVTGNGNYNIGIFNKGKLIRVFYMMDTNGTWHGQTYGYIKDYPPYNVNEHLQRIEGIYPDQREYLYSTCDSINKISGYNVKKSFCCHIGPSFVNKYAHQKGYQSDDSIHNDEEFSLGGDHLVDNIDFGDKGENLGSFDSDTLYPKLKEYNFDTMFIGHYHNNNLSIDCDGIRLNYGVKSSTFDYHRKVGSLLFTFNDSKTYTIEHKFIDKI